MSNTAYYFEETQNPQSRREGRFFTANSLTAAKRRASREQFHQGTCLTIYDVDVDGVGYPIAEKRWGCKWTATAWSGI